jgi:hypothetical protein
MSYTVRYRNEALQSGRYIGTFETPAAASEYAQKEAARSRAFCTYDVWIGTPRMPVEPLKPERVYRGT